MTIVGTARVTVEMQVPDREVNRWYKDRCPGDDPTEEIVRWYWSNTQDQELFDEFMDNADFEVIEDE